MRLGMRTPCVLVMSSIVLISACRVDRRDPRVRAQEKQLVNGSWKSFSEVYYPGRGYLVGFLPFGLVVRESGRMNEAWSWPRINTLAISFRRDRDRVYHWFESEKLFVNCLPGFAKPFLMAPDSLEYEEVIEAAKRAGVYNCDPPAVLMIAGAQVEWADESARMVRSVVLRDATLTRQDRAAIRDLHFVSQIDLSGSVLRDDDLAYLSNLLGLKELTLAYTDIGDAALRHLYPLTELRVLDLRSTNVTDGGVARLQNELRNVRIRR